MRTLIPRVYRLNVLPVLLLGGCGLQQYEARPLEPQRYVSAFAERNLASTELRDFFPQCGLAVERWPHARWDVAALECAGMFFHPDLALARAQIEVARAGEVSAGQRPNPTLRIDVEHHSDTSGDRTPWSIGPGVDITLERPSRRAARIERAMAQTTAAGIDLETRIWAVRRNVRDRFLDLADAEARLQRLGSQSGLLTEGVRLLSRREELGLTSSFEVSNMRIETQRAQLARSGAEARLQTARAALASAVGVPLTAVDGMVMDAGMLTTLPPEDVPDAEDLQGLALTGRTDIRRALQDYAVAEAELKGEIAGQYPDLTLSPGYFFDQADNVWRLGAALMLPLLHRNEGPIAEAQARRELAARAAESVQVSVIGEVQTARAGYRALRQSATEADSLIASLREQEARLKRQFELGETDRLTLLRAQLETMNATMLAADLRMEVWRGLFRLEDAVQTSLHNMTPDSGDVTP